jgi:hypothetical protein
LDKTVVAVGDSARLEVVFDTKNYSSSVTKRPSIITNEGPPDKYVQIKCDIVMRPDSTYPILIKPYKLDLTQFGEKVRSEIKFTIANISDKDLTADIISMPTELFELTLPKVIKAGKTAEGVVKLRKAAIDQKFEKTITLQLNDEKNTRFTIPVKRDVRVPGQEASTPGASPVKPAPVGGGGH